VKRELLVTSAIAQAAEDVFLRERPRTLALAGGRTPMWSSWALLVPTAAGGPTSSGSSTFAAAEPDSGR